MFSLHRLLGNIIRISIALIIISVLALGISIVAVSSTGHIVLGCGGDAFAICKMDPLEHISHLQHLFISLSPQINTIALALILALGFFTYWQLQERLQNNLVFVKNAIDRNQYQSFFNPLQYAFSRGILHPKIF